MRLSRTRSALRRVGILGVLTLCILLVSVALLVRPGSAIHSSFNRWMAIRGIEREVGAQWDDLADAAMPLYDTPGTPEVIEFLDYECPFCRAASPSVDSAVAAGLRVAIIHLPIPTHQVAMPAAIATVCASKVGRGHDAHHLFISTSAWRADTVLSGLPDIAVFATIPAFASCMEHGDAERQVEKHLALATQLGIRQTPVFVSRHSMLREVPTMQSLLALAASR